MAILLTKSVPRVHPEGMERPPDPEVPEKPKRRRFTAEYKLRILEEADACTEAGDVGALLRREALYSGSPAMDVGDGTPFLLVAGRFGVNG